MKRRVAGIAFMLAGFAFACQLVAGIERVEKEPLPAVTLDAQPESAPPVTPDPCVHATPPGKPAVDDAPDVELPPFFLALEQFNMVPPGKTAFGFDLDGVCTCDLRPGSRADGGSTCKPRAGAFCDPDGGIDNQVFTLLSSFGGILDFDKAANINDNFMTGNAGLLIGILRYNGRANDKEVDIGLVRSHGLRVRSMYLDGRPGPDHQNAGDSYPPTREGFDAWSVDPAQVTPLAGAYVPLFKGTGYVVNYQLVVNLEATVGVGFGDGTLSLGSPQVSGKLVPLDATLQPRDGSRPPAAGLEQRFFRLENALLGGRVSSRDWLAGFGVFRTPGSADASVKDKHFCKSPLFETGKQYTCENLDIARSARLDLDPNKECDSLSFGAMFKAGPSLTGEQFAPPEEPNECSPGENGPLSDGPGSTLYLCPPP